MRIVAPFFRRSAWVRNPVRYHFSRISELARTTNVEVAAERFGKRAQQRYVARGANIIRPAA